MTEEIAKRLLKLRRHWDDSNTGRLFGHPYIDASITTRRQQMFSSAIERLHARRDGVGEAGADAGFTLIELMVVLLILAILLAIAIPTFLGVTKSANDRAAQSNLNTAFLNAKAIYQGAGQTYNGSVTPASLYTSEPSLTYTTGNSGSQGQISVFTSADGNGVVLAAYSAAKNCWILADNTSGVGASTVVGPYTNSTPALYLPVTPGTEYGEEAGVTAAQCSAATNLSTATWSTTNFP
jgi:type IV pilus assembly protein PilA